MKKLVLLFSLLLFACDQHSVMLSFDTLSHPKQIFFFESTLSVLVPDSGRSDAESMNASVQFQAVATRLAVYDDSSARYEVKIDSVQYHSSKHSVGEFRYIERYLDQQNFQMKIAKDGVLSAPAVENLDSELDEKKINLARFLLKVQPVLPGKPVHLGESWERQQAISNHGVQTIVYKNFTLEDLFVRDGVSLAKIRINLRYRQVSQDSLVSMESQNFVVGSGSLLFNISTGTIEKTTLEINGLFHIMDNVADLDIPNMRIIQKIKMENHS